MISGFNEIDFKYEEIKMANTIVKLKAVTEDDNVFFAVKENGFYNFVSGKINFSVNVQDGTVEEGDELQVCAMRRTFGKKKLRPILSRTITAEDIENLSKIVKENGIISIAHGMSKKELDDIHMKSASYVSNILPECDELDELLSPYFNVNIKISNDKMYQVTGTKK